MLTIYLVPEGRNAAAEAVVREAANSAFKAVKVTSAENVDAALIQAPHEGTALLVLVEPTLEEVQLGVEAVRADGLPRWGHVILGGEVHGAGAELVRKEDWNAPLLAHVLRGAAERFELARENARFRGDLHTMSRRISHDLRSPLTGIFTSAELVQEILGENSEEDAALAKPLFDSAQALMKLIDRVSFLGKATVEPKPKEEVDMGRIVWEARQGAERLLMQKRGQLTEAETWPVVAGVPAWLQVIWSNLLLNAVQHGGETPKVEAGWTEKGDEYEFWIRDNGSGVPEAKRGTLFQPFHRLHERNSSHGLGLPIVQRLVELQGGRCGYEAGAEGGAYFFFTLPRTHEVADGTL